ncbi:hypothetical protein QBC35DRAFT_215974 [Podospora australis]|uniref:Uncharacterized protein n=1 Tax=Podospora australis TaxID=1536484 RepID=A0AAN6WWW5_9PEZI|nr:hypothetical protein QBC35DRAFT_215974 [Podospora australis]
MPIRNPFARRHGPTIVVQDENQRPGSASGEDAAAAYQPAGFERVDTVGSKASSAFSIRSRKSQDTGEYKMSVVNDSGIYLPPSPVEKEAIWPRRYLSRSSSGKSTGVPGAGDSGEIEHFPISRESFDSYRRSFDICAKSPVVISDAAPRQSLDSSMHRFSRYHGRSGLSFEQSRDWQTPEEEGFEDVGLNEESKQQQQQQQQQHHHHHHHHHQSQQKEEELPSNQATQGTAPAPKKKSFFSKFGGSDSSNVTTPNHHAEGITASWNFLPGRKRAQSGGEARELGAMPRPMLDKPTTSTINATTFAAVAVESS